MSIAAIDPATSAISNTSAYFAAASRSSNSDISSKIGSSEKKLGNNLEQVREVNPAAEKQTKQKEIQSSESQEVQVQSQIKQIGQQQSEVTSSTGSTTATAQQTTIAVASAINTYA